MNKDDSEKIRQKLDEWAARLVKYGHSPEYFGEEVDGLRATLESQRDEHQRLRDECLHFWSKLCETTSHVKGLQSENEELKSRLAKHEEQRTYVEKQWMGEVK